jgi:hypothetical protein
VAWILLEFSLRSSRYARNGLAVVIKFRHNSAAPAMARAGAWGRKDLLFFFLQTYCVISSQFQWLLKMHHCLIQMKVLDLLITGQGNHESGLFGLYCASRTRKIASFISIFTH